MEECRKIVRKLDFLAAIEVADAPSAATEIDLATMVVPDDYDGVRLGETMTQEFIDDMIERFKNGKKIHRKYVYQIIIETMKIVHDEPTMVEVEVPEDVTLTVCGDTHGLSCPSPPYPSFAACRRVANCPPHQANTLILWNCLD